MENVVEKNPTCHSAVLIREANEWHEQFRSHRLESLRKRAKDLLTQTREGDEQAIARFCAHHPHFPKQELCLADSQSVIAREQGFASWPKMKAAMQQATVADEVERIHRKLRVDGFEHFVPIFTEGSLKSAISKGIESYEAGPGADPDKWPGVGEYLRDVVKPLLVQAIEQGLWSDKGTVDVCYKQKDEFGVEYEGLGASLEMRIPGTRYPGFSLAILDIWYGRFQ
jgi:hypothetical protein